MIDEAEVMAIAAKLDPYADYQRANGFPADRGLSLGQLGYDGRWRNAMKTAERVLEMMKQRGWRLVGGAPHGSK
jgi:hypothetical protein